MLKKFKLITILLYLLGTFFLHAQEEYEKWKDKLSTIEESFASSGKSQKIAIINSLKKYFLEVNASDQSQKILFLLTESLKDQDKMVRLRAAQSIIKIANPNLVKLIKTYLSPLQNNKNQQTRQIAKKIIKNIDSRYANATKIFSGDINITIRAGRRFASYFGGSINVTIENLKNKILKNVKVKLYVPFPLKYKSSSLESKWNQKSRTIQWNFSKLDAKQKIVLSVIIKNSSPILSIYAHFMATATINKIIDSSTYTKIVAICTTCYGVGYIRSYSTIRFAAINQPFSYIVDYINDRNNPPNVNLVYTLSKNLVFLDATPKDFTIKDNKIIFSAVPLLKGKVTYKIRCKATSLKFAKGIAEIKTDKLRKERMSLVDEKITKIYPSYIFPTLLKDIQNTDKEIMKQAVNLIIDGADIPNILPIFLQILNFEQKKQNKIKVINAIGRIRPSSVTAITTLVSHFNNDDKNMRSAIIDSLARIRNDKKLFLPHVLPAFLHMLNLEYEKENKIAIIKEIKYTTTPAVMDALISNFSDKNAEVRKVIIDAIDFANNESTQVILLLETAFKDPDISVRISSALYASEMKKKHPSLIPFLLNGVDDLNIDMQNASIAALGNFEYFNNVIILKIANKLQGKGFSEAINYLKKIRSKENVALPIMLKLQLKDLSDRKKLINALKKITGDDYSKKYLSQEEIDVINEEKEDLFEDEDGLWD